MYCTKYLDLRSVNQMSLSPAVTENTENLNKKDILRISLRLILRAPQTILSSTTTHLIFPNKKYLATCYGSYLVRKLFVEMLSISREDPVIE